MLAYCLTKYHSSNDYGVIQYCSSKLCHHIVSIQTLKAKFSSVQKQRAKFSSVQTLSAKFSSV